MFHGTTIDELLNIVKRAEEHAREVKAVRLETKSEVPVSAFLYEVSNQQVMYGVA
jgi:hypothetical protein